MATKEKRHIPQTASEFTPDWFTEHLDQTNGEGSQPRVRSTSHETIGAGIGFMGELYRFHLDWETGDNLAELPASVIVKVPSLIEANRSVGEGLMAYEREIHAYQRFGGKLGIPMPKHYFSDMDPDPAPWAAKGVLFLFEKLPVGGVDWISQQFLKLAGKSKRRYLLVMEDIADARPPMQVEGGSLDDALKSLEVLAQFHAHNWGREELIDDELKIFPSNILPKVFQAGYRRFRDAFVAEWGDRMGNNMVARMDEVQENLPRYMDKLGKNPRTLLHGDFRLDNVLFRHSGNIVVLDYQLLSYGRAGWDVAYFITTALTPDHRSEEEQMLQTYHGALTEAGVSDYSYEALLQDVEDTKLILAHRLMGTGDNIETEVANSDNSLIEVMVTRVFGWVNP